MTVPVPRLSEWSRTEVVKASPVLYKAVFFEISFRVKELFARGPTRIMLGLDVSEPLISKIITFENLMMKAAVIVDMFKWSRPALLSKTFAVEGDVTPPTEEVPTFHVSLLGRMCGERSIVAEGAVYQT